MGHLEACAASAGLASVIVTPLSAGFVAPNAQMRQLNAHLASLLSSSSAAGLFRMSVAADGCMPSVKLCAGGISHVTQSPCDRLSSFGFSGTIAHSSYILTR